MTHEEMAHELRKAGYRVVTPTENRRRSKSWEGFVAELKRRAQKEAKGYKP
jgi:hypothetical protein